MAQSRSLAHVAPGPGWHQKSPARTLETHPAAAHGQRVRSSPSEDSESTTCHPGTGFVENSGSWRGLPSLDLGPASPGRLSLPALQVEGLLGGSVVKNPPAHARDTSSIPVLGRSPEGGNGRPL